MPAEKIEKKTTKNPEKQVADLKDTVLTKTLEKTLEKTKTTTSLSKQSTAKKTIDKKSVEEKTVKKMETKPAAKSSDKKERVPKTKAAATKTTVEKEKKTTRKKSATSVSSAVKTNVSQILRPIGINRGTTIEKPKFKSGNVKITPKIKEELPFDINTYVFYPSDGLGYIESLEKRELGGKTVLYYKIEFKTQRMTAYIPVKKVKMLKIRKAIGKTLAQKVLNILSVVTPPSELSWKDRLTVYQETNKKGNAIEMATMVASLHLRKQQKSLSFQERQYFEFALEAITGEVAVAFGMKEAEAREKVSMALSKLVDAFNSDNSDNSESF